MDGRSTWTDCDEAGDYVVSNVLSPRDLVFTILPLPLPPDMRNDLPDMDIQTNRIDLPDMDIQTNRMA